MSLFSVCTQTTEEIEKGIFQSQNEVKKKEHINTIYIFPLTLL